MSFICPNCQFENPTGMRFCGNCGAKLGEPAQPEPATGSPSPELVERLHKASQDAAGKRRNVTVLFADLSGFTQLGEELDDETLYELVQNLLPALAAEVYKYDGMVDKFTGDGLMALFGAPITHENNAEMAVRAALEMHADAAELSRRYQDILHNPLKLHIGLHCGSVIIGGIAADRQMQYTAIGDTVNLAQRLQDAAPPGVTLASQAVFRQTCPIFDYIPAPTMQLKGLGRPIKGYQLVGPKVIPGSVRGVEGLTSPLIGRQPELCRLQAACETLLEKRQPQVILLTGEAGIGKSRLVSEFKATIPADAEVEILEGQSLTYRRAAPYWIFQNLFRNQLGVGPDTPAHQFRERLIQAVTLALGERAPAALPYLEQLLLLPPSDPESNERIRLLTASQLRQQIFIAVRDFFLAKASACPLILILEDLHWIDQASLSLLCFVIDHLRQAPLLILAVSRLHDEEEAVDLISQHGSRAAGDHFQTIQLTSLPQEHSQRLLYQLLATSEIPAAIQAPILDRASGVPFYMEEILRTLIDKNVLRREAGGWVFPGGQTAIDLEVPETLEDLILARFDRLDDFPRRLLQVASVIGFQFSVPVLHTVLAEVHRDELIGALARLTEREFISPNPGSPYTEYFFRHALMSDAIYKTILKRERMEIHGQIGEAIESVYANRLEGQIEILARHFAWSNRLDKALPYIILAGQKAAHNYANEQARQHYETALSLLGHVQAGPRQAMQCYTGMGDIEVLVGEYPAAREHYNLALAAGRTITTLDSRSLRSEILRKLGTTYERQGEYDQALGCLAEALAELVNSPEPENVEKAQIYNDQGWIAFRRGLLEEAEAMLQTALDLVEKGPAFDVIASIYNRLGAIAFQKEELETASGYVQKSLALRQEIGDIVAVARSYNNLGLLDWRRGNWENALHNLMRSYELHANLGDIEGMIDLHGNLGLLYQDRGDLEQANHHLQEALAKAQQIGHSYMTGMTYKYLLRLNIALEDWHTALDMGNRSMLVFKELGMTDDLPDIYMNLAQAWMGLGNLPMAQKWAREARELIEEGGEQALRSDEHGRCLRLHGDLALLENDYAQAETLFKDCIPIFLRLNNRLELGRTLVSQARLAAVRKDQANGRVLLNEARLIFQQLGAQLDLQRLQALYHVRVTY